MQGSMNVGSIGLGSGTTATDAVPALPKIMPCGATVKKNAENAQEANVSAAATQKVADRGGKVVAEAIAAMAKIEESSRKISDIIGVIDEIARQTNLLALNAAVEAARAGEAGRGFAVVASEVRSLAQRSSQAAKDITNLITNSNAQVKDGVNLVNDAGAALNEIMGAIKNVTMIVSDIANASQEQAAGLDEINRALAARFPKGHAVTYFDAGHVFMRGGRLNRDLFYDPLLRPPAAPLHPTAEGMALLAAAIEPTLVRLLG